MKLRLIGEREAAVSIDGRSTRDRVFWLIPGIYKKNNKSYKYRNCYHVKSTVGNVARQKYGLTQIRYYVVALD